MEQSKIECFLQILPVETYHRPGRVAEDLGQLDGDTDRFRITLHQTYPSVGSWAVNDDSTMDITCLLGEVRLLFEGTDDFIGLIPGAQVVIRKGVKYRWCPLTEKVVLLVMSTPHWSPDQHREIFDDGTLSSLLGKLPSHHREIFDGEVGGSE